MSKVDVSTLAAEICPPLDGPLVDLLLREYVSQERRHVLRDWEPSTLDAGQFCEAAARIIYHQDSGTLNHSKDVSECLKYVEDPQNQNHHKYPDRKSALHTAKAIRAIYKFRSDRGAIHISPTYNANEMDAVFVIQGCRWILAEILRVFWRGDLEAVATAIRDIVEHRVPVIGDFDGRWLVQRTDCSADEEVLLLLYRAADAGLSRRQVGEHCHRGAATVTRTLQALTSRTTRQIIKLPSGNYRLTDLGTQRVMTELADRLVVGG